MTLLVLVPKSRFIHQLLDVKAEVEHSWQGYTGCHNQKGKKGGIEDWRKFYCQMFRNNQNSDTYIPLLTKIYRTHHLQRSLLPRCLIPGVYFMSNHIFQCRAFLAEDPQCPHANLGYWTNIWKALAGLTELQDLRV